MNRRPYALQEAEKIVPLIRSIGGEIKSRSKAIARIEATIETLSRRPSGRECEIYNLDADLALHRRELRNAEKELERLGCSLDADDPFRILIPSPAGHWAYDGPLDETSFRPRPSGQAV